MIAFSTSHLVHNSLPISKSLTTSERTPCFFYHISIIHRFQGLARGDLLGDHFPTYYSPCSCLSQHCSPKPPLIYFLSLSSSLFWKCQENKIIQYVVLCDWLLEHGVFEIHPCCSSTFCNKIYRYVIPLNSWTVFHCRDIHVVYSLTSQWTFYLLQLTTWS